ncbi:MAG: AraC family transcriptional regulator [Ruminococcaceae bacterium]|nr:AraC family transcriptional regulator [Oscillospiraceae bacterium]
MEKQYFHTAAKRMSRYKSSIDNPLLKADLYWCRIRTANVVDKIIGVHTHSSFELHYVLDGEMVIIFENGDRHTLEKGQFALIPPFKAHDTIAYGDDFSKIEFRFTVDHAIDFIHSAIESITSGAAVFNGTEFMSTMVQMMLESAFYARPDVSTMMSNYFECFIMDTMYKVASERKNLKYSGKATGMYDNRRILDIKEFIRSNIGSMLTCEDVANYSNMTLRHLNRLTNKCLGIPVSKLIAQYKIDLIKELLETTDLSLHDISEMAGFQSEYALSRFFKQNEGIPISIYKKNLFK